MVTTETYVPNYIKGRADFVGGRSNMFIKPTSELRQEAESIINKRLRENYVNLNPVQKNALTMYVMALIHDWEIMESHYNGQKGDFNTMTEKDMKEMTEIIVATGLLKTEEIAVLATKTKEGNRNFDYNNRRIVELMSSNPKTKQYAKKYSKEIHQQLRTDGEFVSKRGNPNMKESSGAAELFYKQHISIK
jgi:hypothetical protein